MFGLAFGHNPLDNLGYDLKPIRISWAMHIPLRDYFVKSDMLGNKGQKRGGIERIYKA